MLPAVRAGAVGYLLKDVQPQDLVSAIRTVHAGGTLLHPTVIEELVREVSRDGEAPAAPNPLTAREREVLALIARGRANKAIAFDLGVAEKTVKTHVSNILGKLGLSDRTQAALYAVREGLVDSCRARADGHRRARGHGLVLGPIPDTGRAPAGVASSSWPSTALITGASRGLGLALARALAARHWRLVIDARGADALEAAAPRARRRSTDVTALVGDVGDERHRRALVTAAGDRIDAAGQQRQHPRPQPAAAAGRLPARRPRARLTVNVARAAAPDPARAAAPCRRVRRIVNVTSDAAVEAYEGWGGYGSSKAALEQLTRVLAVERPSCGLRRRPRRHEHRGCTRRRSRARTSPTARRPRTACPRCSRCSRATCPAAATGDADLEVAA